MSVTLTNKHNSAEAMIKEIFRPHINSVWERTSIATVIH